MSYDCDREICRKCGYVGRPDARYTRIGRGYGQLLDSTKQFIPEGEHLIVSCRNCGYERLEPVKEAG